MTSSCPSDLGLEHYLLAPEKSEMREHVAHCPACQARLKPMEEQGREFQTYVYPATLDSVLEKSGRRWTEWLKPLVWATPALVAAAAVLFLIRVPRPPSDYVGAKGNTLRLAAFANLGGSPLPLANGDSVAANSQLRFRVQTAKQCYLSLLSVDERGEVSALFPAENNASAPVSGAVDLPGGAILDGRTGPERLFAVCSPSALDFESLARAARQSIAPGVASVRAKTELSGLPAGTLQSSLLIEKQ